MKENSNKFRYERLKKTIIIIIQKKTKHFNQDYIRYQGYVENFYITLDASSQFVIIYPPPTLLPKKTQTN